MKIIIIGAGVAGLTLGLACQRAGYTVKIYEKTHGLRNIGGGIVIWPHGIRYLEWLGLADCLAPYWVGLNKCNIVSDNNEILFSEDCSHFYQLVGGTALPIVRNQFQQALLQALPRDCLSLGKHCVSISEDAAMARVTFADGSEDQADLVVGADGIHSVVRQWLNPTMAPQYTNLCWWGGIVESHVVPHFPADASYVAVGSGKAFFAWPVSGNKFIWYLPIRMPADKLTLEKNGLPQLQTLCAGWNSDVERIVAATSADNHFHLAINTLSAPEHWSTQRVTLIGDAVHAMGPILAQGASLAIEDAFALINCLQKNNADMPVILKHYESLRRDTYARIFSLENQSADMMVTDDVTTLETLQQQMKYLNLVTMYKELIPLVDENACQRLAASTRLLQETCSV